MTKQKEIDVPTNNVGEEKINLFGALRAPTKEEEERGVREKLQEEMRNTIEVVIDTLVKQRPDEQLGEFWENLDEGSKLTLFWDWFSRASHLNWMVSETSALSLEGLMRLQREKLKIEKKEKILPTSTIADRIKKATQLVADGKSKEFETPISPKLKKKDEE